MNNLISYTDNEIITVCKSHLFPYRIVPQFDNAGLGLMYIKIFGGFGEINVEHTLSKEALLYTLDTIRLLNLVKTHIAHAIEKAFMTKRYKDTIKERHGTKVNYMVDICMPRKDIIIAIHPEMYNDLLKYNDDTYDIIQQLLKERIIKEKKKKQHINK